MTCLNSSYFWRKISMLLCKVPPCLRLVRCHKYKSLYVSTYWSGLENPGLNYRADNHLPRTAYPGPECLGKSTQVTERYPRYVDHSSSYRSLVRNKGSQMIFWGTNDKQGAGVAITIRSGVIRKQEVNTTEYVSGELEQNKTGSHNINWTKKIRSTQNRV